MSVPSGWYDDPDDEKQMRYWDGNAWTEHRQPKAQAPASPPPPAVTGSIPSAAPFGRKGARGLASVRKAASSVRDSGVVGRVAESASAAGHRVAEVARDPSLRQAVAQGANPSLTGALDGAGLRNKKGKVKVWRVARAAVRPRKTVTRAGQGAAAAGGAQIAAALAGRNVERVAPREEDIAAGWPPVDVELARARWQEGSAAFAAASDDDAAAMRSAAHLLADPLRVSLLGDPLLDDDAMVELAGNALAAIMCVPDAEWADVDNAVVRLALALVRRYGVQPEDLGGNGELDLLFEDDHSRMRMAMAMAPTRWSCDLAPWFADGA